MQANPVIVEQTRGTWVENRHRGAFIVADADGNVIHAGNIDASGTALWTGGFNPVGGSTPFTGNFTGQNRIISGLTVNRPTAAFAGLFGHTLGSTLSDVTLTGLDHRRRRVEADHSLGVDRCDRGPGLFLRCVAGDLQDLPARLLPERTPRADPRGRGRGPGRARRETAACCFPLLR